MLFQPAHGSNHKLNGSHETAADRCKGAAYPNPQLVRCVFIVFPPHRILRKAAFRGMATICDGSVANGMPCLQHQEIKCECVCGIAKQEQFRFMKKGEAGWFPCRGCGSQSAWGKPNILELKENIFSCPTQGWDCGAILCVFHICIRTGQPYPLPTEEKMAAAEAVERRHLPDVVRSRFTPNRALSLADRDNRFAVTRLLQGRGLVQPQEKEPAGGNLNIGAGFVSEFMCWNGR